jgi:hypothetical protein
VIGLDGLDVDALPDPQDVARVLQFINSSLNRPEWLAQRVPDWNRLPSN